MGVGGWLEDRFKDVTQPGWQERDAAARGQGQAVEAQRQAVQDWEQLEGRTPGYVDPQLYTQDASQAGGAQADPEAIAAQRAALGQYQQLSQEGFSAQDQAQMEQIAGQEDMRAKASREAAQANLAARGMATGGSQLVGQQMAAQGAAERLSARNLGVAEMGQMRRREALAGMAGLGGEMRGASFGEAYNRGTAEDIRNRFNVGMRTQQDTEMDRRRQQQYQNYAQSTAGKAGARQGVAQQYGQQAGYQERQAAQPSFLERREASAAEGFKVAGAG